MAQTALLVDCHKIINWLQQRRKLPKDWYNYEKAAEQKTKLLLKDLQQYENSGNQNLVPYLKQNIQNFHYCDVVNTVNILLTTKWAENKSLVFGYSDKRVKQWVDLKKFMQNKQLSIVNTAKFINQGLNFDLPSLDKNVELLDNQISNLKRKIDFNLNTVYQQEKQSLNQKIKMGLKTGDQQLSVVDQIPRLVKEIPQLFKNVEQKTKDLQQYYNVYIKSFQTDENNQSLKLNMLQYLIANGNTSLKNWQLSKNGSINKQQMKNQQKYAQFNQWKPFNEWGILIEGDSNKKEKFVKIQTFLQNRNTRLQLIQDLNQLLYFYQGVKYEQSLKSKLTTLQSASNITLVQDQLQQAISKIQSCINLIVGTIAIRVQLKNNTKAYQILLRKFRNYQQNIQQIKKQNQQYQIQIEQMKIRRQEIVKNLRKLRSRLVQSKNNCEKYMTQFMKRQIRITGDINKLQ